MDDVFQTTEQAVAEAGSAADLKRAVAAVLLNLFPSRPATRAQLSKVVMVEIERLHTLEEKRRAASTMLQSIRGTLRNKSEAG